MSSQPSNTHDTISQTLQANRAELLARGGYSEDDTIRLLITPFLEYLGHAAPHRRSEHEVNRNRPDEIIWDGPVSIFGNRPSRIILEAKPLGTDFDRGASRTETPARQIRRYLQNHVSSGPDTYGVLTDGVRYRVSQRTGHLNDVKHIGEWNILDGQAAIAEVVNLLRHGSIPAASQAVAATSSAARTLADAIANGRSPGRILDLLTRDQDQKPEIRTELTPAGHWTQRKTTGKAMPGAMELESKPTGRIWRAAVSQQPLLDTQPQNREITQS